MSRIVKSLWASIQGDPLFMRRLNGWLTIFWILMIPVSLITGWISSVTYVAALSLWALVSGHWSAWQAARVEVMQQEQAEEEAERDEAGELVERIVEETEVQRDREASATRSQPRRTT
jgi:type VI protein secretion system component VasK